MARRLRNWLPVLTGLALTVLGLPATPQAASVPPAPGGDALQAVDLSAFEGRAIVSLIIDTHAPYDAKPVLRQTGIGVGRRFDADAIRASMTRLYETGLFSNIAVEAESRTDGVAVIYHLWAKQLIREVIVTGHSLNFPTTPLRKALQLREGEEFSRQRLQAALARLIQFYAKHGYMQTRVLPTVTILPNHINVRLVISIQEGQQAQIGKVTFAGQLGLHEKAIRKRLDLTPGSPYTAGEVNDRIAELKRLYADEHFLLVVIEPAAAHYDPVTNRVDVTINVHAGPRVTIDFPGNPYWREAPLRKRLLILTEQSIDEDVLEASAERIRNMLRDDGYLSATVQATREDSAHHHRVMISFRINAGPRYEVGQLVVTGAQQDHVVLWRKFLHMRPMMLGLHHPRFDPVAWEEDQARVRLWYSENGFLSAVVDGRQALQVRTGTVDLTIDVREGVQTRIDRIVFSGNHHVPDSVLQQSLHARVGRPYDPAQARADRLSMLALYASKGYLTATVTMDPQLNEARTEVVLSFAISEGSPTFVGTIAIEGNQDTADYVLRRELVIHSNDPYNYEHILQSRHNLARQGIFQDIKFEPIVPQRTELLRDLKLSVVERPAGTVEFGAGYGSYEKLRGFVQVSHKNIAGTGRRISLRVEASFIGQRAVINYVEPWAFGLPIDLRFIPFVESKQEVSFKRQSYGGTISFDKNLTKELKFTLQYRFSRDHYNIYAGASLPPDELERVNIGSITPGLILDLRDDPFNPTRGSIHSLTFEDAAQSLGSQVQFVKATASSSWFFSPYRLIVFALSARGGIAKEFGDSTLVPLGERFYQGGISTNRGYRQDEVGVLHVVPDKANPGFLKVASDSTLSATGDPIGGNVTLLTNVETRIALPAHLGLVFFLDGGQVWTTPGTVNLTEMKFSVGAGIRYNTPVGPLRLDWGYKLRPIDVRYVSPDTSIDPNINVHESQYEIQFTLGNAF
jgi:outer membrane protein insertion porin family